PSVHNGQYMVVDTWTYRFSHPPRRGDVIVTVAPFNAKLLLLKRIVGIPFDTISISNTRVAVNGVTLDEKYVSPALQGNPNDNKYEQVTLQKDEFWVLGDNRAYSGDSREFGVVPRKDIIGRV